MHDVDESWGDVPAEWNELTSRVIGCAIEVHRHLGQGLLEKLYEAAFVHELRSTGLRLEQQRVERVPYKDIVLPEQVFDVVVENLIVVELKAVAAVADAHLAQLVSYLRVARLPLGLLINFHVPRLADGVYRRINSSAIPQRSPRPLRSI